MTHDLGSQPTVRHPVSYRLTACAVIATGLAASGIALAQEGATLAEPAPAAPGGVACTVSGYDVIIRNNGTDPIASGASVEWSVPFARKEGSHALTKDLEAGGRVFLAGALGSNFLSSKVECEATLGAQAQPATDADFPSPPSQN